LVRRTPPDRWIDESTCWRQRFGWTSGTPADYGGARVAERQNIDPGQRGHAWVERVAWVVVALSCWQILLFGHGRDQGIYSVVAESMLEGGMPYRDAWDFKPPGIFLIFAFAEALFGKSMVSIRLLEVAGLVGSVFAYRRIARSAFGTRLPGTIGGALATLTHAQLEFWHTAQPEAFGGMLTAFALTIVVGNAEHPGALPSRARAWATCGALFGAAFLLKPPLGGAAIPCALYLGASEYFATRKASRALLPAIVLGAASLLPIAVCALWFQLRGAWPALSWTLFEFTPGYTRLGWNYSLISLFQYGVEQAVTYFSYVIPAGLAAAVLLPRLHPRERGVVALAIGVALVQVLGIALQAKFFQYHYSATLSILAFLAGLGLTKVWNYTQRIPAIPVIGAVAFVIGLVVLFRARTATPQVPGTFWERSADRVAFVLLRKESHDALEDRLYRAADYELGADRRMAQEVASRTSAGEPVFVWGFEPIVYWLSGRRPASRYIYNVPQRAQWQRDRARNELLADLRANPPRAVVVQHGDFLKHVTGDSLDSSEALPTFPELAALLNDGYRYAARASRLDVFVPK